MNKQDRLALIKARHKARPALSEEAAQMLEELCADTELCSVIVPPEDIAPQKKERFFNISDCKDEEIQKESFCFESSLKSCFDDEEEEIKKYEKEIAE